jgi:hypothetical protein
MADRSFEERGGQRRNEFPARVAGRLADPVIDCLL